MRIDSSHRQEIIRFVGQKDGVTITEVSRYMNIPSNDVERELRKLVHLDCLRKERQRFFRNFVVIRHPEKKR